MNITQSLTTSKTKSLVTTDVVMEQSFNSEQKIFIRENWNKPILKFLTKRVSDKLVYLGLPSPKAEDILEWIGYIKTVIAFQCRDYREKSMDDQSREGVFALNKLLSQLEREKRIENYLVFDGWLEEVVLRGYDNSPTRINFELSDFITLYNLDFCNKITSPIEFLDKNGNPQIAYKLHAINKLLQIQKSLSKVSHKFVLFFTIHCSYNEVEILDFISHPPSEEIKDYMYRCQRLDGNDKNARIVRLFFTYYIKQQFETFGFTPKILPSLFYKGLGETNMLHFTVFGICPSTTMAGSVPSYQSITEILHQKFISIDSSSFVNNTIDFEGEHDVELNPVKLFSESITFKKLWLA